ncbi:hypothetical protein L1887_11083 [Cichorium endivia]|nr:hypothetical protein L1887_11083 [Cichorium endivia]
MARASRMNGTSTILARLKNVCRTSPFYKKKEPKKQSTLRFKPTNEGACGSGSLATHLFSQEKCKLALVKMCIKENHPFSVVDDEGFREFVWELKPNFKFISRWTIPIMELIFKVKLIVIVYGTQEKGKRNVKVIGASSDTIGRPQARLVLAMPISTVASESTFSIGGRVIDKYKYRSFLNTDTAKALTCTQDWLRSTPADLELIHLQNAKIMRWFRGYKEV